MASLLPPAHPAEAQRPLVVSVQAQAIVDHLCLLSDEAELRQVGATLQLLAERSSAGMQGRMWALQPLLDGWALLLSCLFLRRSISLLLPCCPRSSLPMTMRLAGRTACSCPKSSASSPQWGSTFQRQASDEFCHCAASGEASLMAGPQNIVSGRRDAALGRAWWHHPSLLHVTLCPFHAALAWHWAGGSASNTTRGLAGFGVPTQLLGVRGFDEVGGCLHAGLAPIVTRHVAARPLLASACCGRLACSTGRR